MSTCILLACTGLALAGCADSLRERPLAAADMPASFVYGALGPANAAYRAAVEGRRGSEVRRMTLQAQSEFAVFDVITLQGDYIFNEGSFRRQIEAMMGDKPVEWQEAGTLAGARPTRLQTFALTLTEGQLACVGLRRPLKRHRDAPTDSGNSQAIAVGFYCRAGAVIPLAEAERIAAALQT
jgi:hypothetical protein